MEKSRQWSIELHLVGQKSRGNLVLNHFYNLEQLILLAQPHKKAGNIKAKFVPTWIINDIPQLMVAYIERGYTLEKFIIKR